MSFPGFSIDATRSSNTNAMAGVPTGVLMFFSSFPIYSCIDTDIWHSGLTSNSCEDGVCGMALHRTGDALVQFPHCHDVLRLLRRSELASKGDSVGAEPAMLFDNKGDD